MWVDIMTGWPPLQQTDRDLHHADPCSAYSAALVRQRQHTVAMAKEVGALRTWVHTVYQIRNVQGDDKGWICYVHRYSTLSAPPPHCRLRVTLFAGNNEIIERVRVESTGVVENFHRSMLPVCSFPTSFPNRLAPRWAQCFTGTV